MITWTNWNNGESLLLLRTNLNSFNNAAATDVNANATAIAALQSKDTSLDGDITALDGRVTQNEADVTALDGRVTVNEADLVSLHAIQDAFDYSNADGSSTTSNTYTTLNSVSLTAAPVGIYQMLNTVAFTYSTTTRSAYFRVSLDGGTTWVEYREEVKDVTDTNLTTQMCVIDHTVAGDLSVLIQFRTENNGDSLAILKNCMTLERKS